MSAGFLLDTNVLSELMRENPAPEVLNWFAGQPASQLHTSAITQAELLAGIAFLPAGKRRDALAQSVYQIFENDMPGRCIAFGSAAAQHYALIRAQRRQAGRPVTLSSTLPARKWLISLETGVQSQTTKRVW
jgi:hypothetical protein